MFATLTRVFYTTKTGKAMVSHVEVDETASEVARLEKRGYTIQDVKRPLPAGWVALHGDTRPRYHTA